MVLMKKRSFLHLLKRYIRISLELLVKFLLSAYCSLSPPFYCSLPGLVITFTNRHQRNLPERIITSVQDRLVYNEFIYAYVCKLVALVWFCLVWSYLQTHDCFRT